MSSYHCAFLVLALVSGGLTLIRRSFQLARILIFQCTTCGAEDKHDRRDCPFGLVCFSCGTPGHRSAVCQFNGASDCKTGC